MSHKTTKPAPRLAAILLACAALAPACLQAQEGHPLTGSWSGERTVDGQDSRVLLVLDLQRDQSFEGYAIESRSRIPLKSVMLDPSDWSVSIVLEGQDRNGQTISYELDGKIENLGSIDERSIVGTWSAEGGESGAFRLMRN